MNEGRKYSRKEILDSLRAARETVDEAEIPDDLKEAAFSRAFDAFLGASVPSAEPGGELQSLGPSGESTTALASIGRRLALDEATISDVYHLDDGEIAIGIAPSRFDRLKSAGTKQIALLLAAGRQATGVEEWTPVGVVRDVTRDYGRFDPSNFAATIKGMGDVFNFRGRGRDIEVRVTRPGFERARELIRELLAD